MKKLFVYFCFSLHLAMTFAQIEISTEIIQYNGKPYYVHEIKQGQTVYSIAKAYQVSTDEIFEVNAFAREGIKPGQLLKIPAPESAMLKKDEPQISSTQNTDTLYLLTYVADEDILLSQIAKKLQISQNEILKYNPDFKNKEIVRANDILTLPVYSVDVLIEYLIKKPRAQVILLITHQVQKGETVYSISRNYGCAKEELFMMNPGIDEKIKVGQKLWVPAKEQFKYKSATSRLPEPECKKINKKAHYNLALLVPFYLDQVSSIVIHTDARKNQNKNFKSFDYIQFYEGFLLAFQTLDFNNATFTIHVYDVSTEEKVSTLISRGLLDVDCIIGPFFRKPLERLHEYTREKDIKIFDLYLPEEIDYNLNNQNLLSILPSISEQLKGMLQFIKDFQPQQKVIFVYNDNTNEKILADKVRALQTEIGITVEFYQYSSEGISGLVRLLHTDNPNVIICFTNNEVFLNSFTRSLFDYAANYPVTLFGLPSWLRFESIDLRYLNHFNTHFFSSQFIDYSESKVKTFISAFQNRYYTDPNRLAFLGYDVASYVLGIISQYGTDFPHCTKFYNPELLSTRFHFERSVPNGQLQNMHVAIYEIIEFQLFDSRKVPGNNK